MAAAGADANEYKSMSIQNHKRVYPNATLTYFKAKDGFYYVREDFHEGYNSNLIPQYDSHVFQYKKVGDQYRKVGAVDGLTVEFDSYNAENQSLAPLPNMLATPPSNLQQYLAGASAGAGGAGAGAGGMMNYGNPKPKFRHPNDPENHKFNYTNRLRHQADTYSAFIGGQNYYKGLTHLQPYEGSLVWLGTRTFSGLTDFLFITYDTHNKAYIVLKQDEYTKTWKQHFIREDPRNPFYWGFQNPDKLHFIFGELYIINGKKLMYAGFQYKSPAEFSKIMEFTSKELNEDFYRIFFDYSENGETLSMHNSNIKSAELAKSNENNKAGPQSKLPPRQRFLAPEEAGAAPFAGRFPEFEEQRSQFGQVVPRTGINPATLRNAQEKSRLNRIKMAKAAKEMAKAAKEMAARQGFVEALSEVESAAAAPIRGLSPLEEERVAFGRVHTRKNETLRNRQQNYAKYRNIIARQAERNAIAKLKKNTYNRLAAEEALLNKARRRATERRAGVASIAAAAEAALAQQRAYNEARAQVNPNVNRMLEPGHRGLLNRYTRNAKALKAAAPATGPVAAVLTPARTPVPVRTVNAVDMMVNPMLAARPGAGAGAGGQQQMQRLIFGTRKNQNQNGSRAKFGPSYTRNNPLRKGK